MFPERLSGRGGLRPPPPFQRKKNSKTYHHWNKGQCFETFHPQNKIGFLSFTGVALEVFTLLWIFVTYRLHRRKKNSRGREMTWMPRSVRPRKKSVPWRTRSNWWITGTKLTGKASTKSLSPVSLQQVFLTSVGQQMVPDLFDIYHITHLLNVIVENIILCKCINFLLWYI